MTDKVDKDEIRFNPIVAEYQFAFVLLHEFSHIYYNKNEEVLAGNQLSMKENLVNLRKQLNTDKPLLARILHTIIPKMQDMQEHSFDEAIAKSELQEEMLCDDAAWRMTNRLIKENNQNVRVQARLSAYVIFTLYHIEAKRTLENIYLTTDNDLRQKDLMFDTTRSTVLVNTAWDDVSPEAIKQYKLLVNGISRQSRLHLMLSLRKNIDYIGYIRHISKEKYSPKEVRRLDAIYNKVTEKLRVNFEL